MARLNPHGESRTLLSGAMMGNEIPIVYSTTHNEIIKEETQVDLCKEKTFEYCYHYYITLSQSQGFRWNQDLFVTQYQQNYQVEYDGHEDSFSENEKMAKSQNMTYLPQGRRYRRRSNSNSISFKRDSKNGLINLPSLLNEYLEQSNNDDDNDDNGSNMKEKELVTKREFKKHIDHYKWLLS